MLGFPLPLSNMAIETAVASTSGASLPSDDDVQIAFLRSISLRRPIGPHKHFKMLSVVLDTQKALDTRYQRLAARLESLSTAAPPSIATDKKAKPPTLSSGSTSGATSRIRRTAVPSLGHSRKGSRSRSGSVASSAPAEEDGDRTEDDAEQNEEEERERQHETEQTRLAIAELGLDRTVTPAMIWNELHSLFDLEALDEMEEGAIFDNSSQAGTNTDAGDSSSSETTSHSSPAASKRNRGGSTNPSSELNKGRALPAEVLSRCVFEHPGSPDFHSDGDRKLRPSQQSQNWIYGDDIRGTGDGMSRRDFYLWPWEEFEPLIAKRRLASSEEEERGVDSGQRGSVASEAASAHRKLKRSASPIDHDTKTIVKDEAERSVGNQEDEDLSELDTDADLSKDSTPRRRTSRRAQAAGEPKSKSGRSEPRDAIDAQSDDDKPGEDTKVEDDAEAVADSDEDEDEPDQVTTRRGSRKAPTSSNRISRQTPVGRKSTSGTVTPTRSTRRSRRAGNDGGEASDDETAEEEKAEASEEEEEAEPAGTQSDAEETSRRRPGRVQQPAFARKSSKKRGAPSSDEEDQDSRPSVRRRSSRRASKSDEADAANEDGEDEEMADAKEEQSHAGSEAAAGSGSERGDAVEEGGRQEDSEEGEEGEDEDEAGSNQGSEGEEGSEREEEEDDGREDGSEGGSAPGRRSKASSKGAASRAQGRSTGAGQAGRSTRASVVSRSSAAMEPALSTPPKQTRSSRSSVTPAGSSARRGSNDKQQPASTPTPRTPAAGRATTRNTASSDTRSTRRTPRR